MTLEQFFDETLELPNTTAGERLASLVGLDDACDRLRKELLLLLDREGLRAWSENHHGSVLPAVEELARRSALVLIAGDVGCGKTTLAETFADPIARERRISVRVFRMSLRVRGKGAVGEMTNLVTAAFEEVARVARERSRGERASSISVLLIDEADALAQSRELAEMHHEDRAGVNAVIRGINRLTEQRLPVLVVMCTNRLDAVDPAIRRRAAIEISVGRPDESQRRAVIARALGNVLGEAQLDDVARATGATQQRPYGYTYSDLRERLLPAALLACYPDRPLTVDAILDQISQVAPTPPFEAA